MSSAVLVLAMRSRAGVRGCGGVWVRGYSSANSPLEYPPLLLCPPAPSHLWASTQKGG